MSTRNKAAVILMLLTVCVDFLLFYGMGVDITAVSVLILVFIFLWSRGNLIVDFGTVKEGQIEGLDKVEMIETTYPNGTVAFRKIKKDGVKVSAQVLNEGKTLKINITDKEGT